MAPLKGPQLASCVASGTIEIQGVKFLFSSRYFKRDEKSHHIQTYVYKCSRGNWFVLYQLSKNLNQPFFMDFLKNIFLFLSSPQLLSHFLS